MKEKTGKTRGRRRERSKKAWVSAKARVRAKIVRAPSIERVTRECEVIYEQ
jgi:hypothetical protein